MKWYFGPIIMAAVVFLSMSGLATAAQVTGKIVIFHAGSLTIPLAEMEKRFETRHPGVDIERKSGGSTKMARLISENGKRGLEIQANLPGNRHRRAHQLSGGEKAITSLALKLAVFQELDSPFYLLDEVEPSLDYTNHKSMQAFLKDVAATKQLVMITHLRSTIELANTLHGVRTRFDGSSFMKFYFVMDERLLRLYKCC